MLPFIYRVFFYVFKCFSNICHIYMCDLLHLYICSYICTYLSDMALACLLAPIFCQDDDLNTKKMGILWGLNQYIIFARIQYEWSFIDPNCLFPFSSSSLFPRVSLTALANQKNPMVACTHVGTHMNLHSNSFIACLRTKHPVVRSRSEACVQVCIFGRTSCLSCQQ